MSDGAAERVVYDRVADAIGEALRTLAHDAANCAAVFDMEVSELSVDASGAADSLRAATERLRAHVQDLRALAAAKRSEGASLDEVLQLALRLLSRSARRDLTRTPGERVAFRVSASQLSLLLGLLVVLRAVLRPTEGAGLVRASAGPEDGRGAITLEVAMDAAAFDELLAIARGAFSELGVAEAAEARPGADAVRVLSLRFAAA